MISDSTSQPSSRTAKSGKFTLLSRAVKHSDIHLEVLFLPSCKSFEYFFCFHRTLGISAKDFEGFKACLLAGNFHKFDFDLTFVTQNFIGSCLSDVRFDWLVGKMIV